MALTIKWNVNNRSLKLFEKKKKMPSCLLVLWAGESVLRGVYFDK